MRRAKSQPIRNKINPNDPAQVRVWIRRFSIRPPDLERVVGRVGNSIAAVSKELELRGADKSKRPSRRSVRLQVP